MKTSRVTVDGGTAAWLEALVKVVHLPTAEIVRTLSYATFDDCTAPGFLDTSLGYAAWRSSYCSRASSGVR